jgi:phosphatidylserine/phosphatidylglycerophosphate/cardiolipin synthase-like enzyme
MSDATIRRAFWRTAEATRVSVIVDADDYFRAARSAMLKAKRRILLIGWDFDARIHFAGDGQDEGPPTVGAFISWLVKQSPLLEVHILRWDTGALKTLFHGRTLLTLLRWMRDPQIHLKLDGHHPVAGSHHQKIVVIDDCVAFCGGIDMTRERWDTRAHRDSEPRRITPAGKPHGPWHDAAMALEGPVARALGDACRDRWRAAGGRPLDPVTGGRDCWPAGLAADFVNVPVGISRTLPHMDDQEPVHEIEALYVALIARARRLIYAESQYFASRRVAEAIARRLDEPDGPEIVIVNPTTANGWLEPIAMDTARARLVAELRKRDVLGRFRLYHPITADGVPIYVHAKVTVIDDEVLRVGSSNFNNRSLRLDTECDVTIDAAGAPDVGVERAIADIRDGLLAEHLGATREAVASKMAETGSLIASIAALQTPGRSLRDYELPELTAAGEWLADTELLDPEGPDAMFEPLSRRRGLLFHLRHRHRGRSRHRRA